MNGFGEIPLAVVASALALGAALGLWSAVKRALGNKLGADQAAVEGLVSGLHLTLVPAAVVFGVLVDVWGAREVFCLGTLLTALGLFGIAIGRTYRSCLRGVLTAGLGVGALYPAACVLMTAGLFENSPAASLNLGFVFVGLGTVLAPVVVEPLARVAGFRRTLIAAAALCLAPALVVLLTREHPAAAAKEAADVGGPFTNPMLWLAAAIFLCYAPVDSWLGTAAPRYLAESGISRSRVPLLMTEVWLLFLGSRWLTAYFLHQELLGPASDVWLLLILALWAAVVVGNLAGRHTEAGAAWGLRCLGVSLGPIFPTLIGVAFRLSEPRQHGTAFGVVFAAGTVASLAVAPLCRPGSQKGTALRAAPHVFAAIILVVASAVLALLVER